MLAFTTPRALLLAATLFGACATTASATTVSFEGVIPAGGTGSGTVSADGTFNDPDSALNDYWAFNVQAGLTYTVTVIRTEADLDPALWLFEGIIADTDAFAGGSVADLIDSDDPGFIGFADDELSNPGPFGDPQFTFTADFTATTTGAVTAIVTNFLSGPNDGGDGFFGYNISVSDPAAVPLPASLPLLLAGAGGLAALRRFRSKKG